MDAKIETKVMVILKLTKEEALWLKSAVQTPVNIPKNCIEEDIEYNMRIKFWNALTDIS